MKTNTLVAARLIDRDEIMGLATQGVIQIKVLKIFFILPAVARVRLS